MIPFWVIERALEGDIQAINKVLKHYEGYIAKLSVRKMYDEYGCVHYCVDETLRRRLETKIDKNNYLDLKIVSLKNILRASLFCWKKFI